jgi:predicted dehydrogenase
MDKVRIGIVGLGVMGSNHAKFIFDGQVKNGELTAVCDTEANKMDWIKKEHPHIKCFNNAADMLDSGVIDAVLISTPHYDHPTIAMEAFEKGIHTMIEKPAGVFTQNVREMNKKAAESNVVFGIMYNNRTVPMYQKMREIVQGGQLGNIKRTSWLITEWYRPQAYYNSGGWRATWKGEGGGVLLNQCPHNLDLWQWICGMPDKVTAFLHEGKWHDIEVEDDVTAYVEYPNGATGIFVTGTADMPGDNRFAVMGDLGKLVCENGKLTHYKLKTNERDFNRDNTIMFGAPEYEVIELDCSGEGSMHSGIMTAFIEKIQGKGEMVAGGEEGINGLLLSNAMHLSAWLGKTIELPLDEELFLSELKKKW